MLRKKVKTSIVISHEGSEAIYKLTGTPTIQRLGHIEKELNSAKGYLDTKSILWDLSELERMDSALALMIVKEVQYAKNSEQDVAFSVMKPDVEKMLRMVEEHAHFGTTFTPPKEGLLEALGRDSEARFEKFLSFFAFFGELSMIFFTVVWKLKTFRWKETVYEINESGIKALPIIILTTFLIGVVVAYQSAAQLKLYGANIFIVDMLGISILRELAPMLAAIIVAGRSGSAYAAQIGVMKITEELDAMRTMGFDPYAFLVLPRMLALMIMMPMLIFFADISGVIGGILIAKIELGLSPRLFLERFVEVVSVKHFIIGLMKGPFFAVLIASIGIYRGLQVKNDTQSIGFNTTKAVVESIFAVIICDAFFSIVFTNLGY